MFKYIIYQKGYCTSWERFSKCYQQLRRERTRIVYTLCHINCIIQLTIDYMHSSMPTDIDKAYIKYIFYLYLYYIYSYIALCALSSIADNILKTVPNSCIPPFELLHPLSKGNNKYHIIIVGKKTFFLVPDFLVFS